MTTVVDETKPKKSRKKDKPEAQTLADVRRALTDGDVRVGMWLVALPAVAFGVIDVLVPLRLHDLGVGAAGVAAAFLAAAAVESAESPIVGRISDRRGRLVPIRAGLAAAVVALLLLPAPGSALLVAMVFVATTASLGAFWAPAMALLSDAAERTGVAQGIAFALVNLGWGLGQVLGAAGGGGLAKLTSDAVPLALCGAGCAGTLALLHGRRAIVRVTAGAA
jgi:MFS family permease